MKNTTEDNEARSRESRPQVGMIQPSYGRYGGWYGIIAGRPNQFFSTRKKAKDWFDRLGVTPVYC